MDFTKAFSVKTKSGKILHFGPILPDLGGMREITMEGGKLPFTMGILRGSGTATLQEFTVMHTEPVEGEHLGIHYMAGAAMQTYFTSRIEKITQE